MAAVSIRVEVQKLWGASWILGAVNVAGVVIPSFIIVVKKRLIGSLIIGYFSSEYI